MFSDMQSQFKDFWFFRKFPATFIRIQSSGGKSVGLFIGVQNYRNFPHWQDILHKAACYRKTKKYPKTDKKFKTTETHLEYIEFLYYQYRLYIYQYLDTTLVQILLCQRKLVCWLGNANMYTSVNLIKI